MLHIHIYIYIYDISRLWVKRITVILKWLTHTIMYMQCSAANDFVVFIYTKGVTIQPTYTVIIPSKHLKLSSENSPSGGGKL